MHVHVPRCIPYFVPHPPFAPFSPVRPGQLCMCSSGTAHHGSSLEPCFYLFLPFYPSSWQTRGPQYVIASHPISARATTLGADNGSDRAVGNWLPPPPVFASPRLPHAHIDTLRQVQYAWYISASRGSPLAHVYLDRHIPKTPFSALSRANKKNRRSSKTNHREKTHQEQENLPRPSPSRQL